MSFFDEVLPSASRFAVVVSPPTPVPEHRRELEEAGCILGVTVSIAQVSGPEDFADVPASTPTATPVRTQGGSRPSGWTDEKRPPLCYKFRVWGPGVGRPCGRSRTTSLNPVIVFPPSRS